MLERTVTVPAALDLRATLGPLQLGRGDPTLRLSADAVAWARHTPHGPATVVVRLGGSRARCRAWGPGAEWVLEQAPRLLGLLDVPVGFTPHHPVVARAARRAPGLRLGAATTVAAVLVQTIVSQKVTGTQAQRAWTRVVRRHGEPAPGNVDLRLPPTAAELARLPYETYHPLGIERRRADTIRRACARIDRLEEAATAPAPLAQARLSALPGLGPWTAATIRRLAFGDPDAVETGDFHLPNLVTWNLAGEPRGDDARMLELLEPYRGQRGRVVRLLEVAGARAPRYGPRMSVPPSLVSSPRPNG